MRKVEVYVNDQLAAYLSETTDKKYLFEYFNDYSGHPVSLTLPVTKRSYQFDFFPAFFDGLLPEGQQLEGLLRHRKIDSSDHLSQLIAVGNDMVGSVTIKEIKP